MVFNRFLKVFTFLLPLFLSSVLFVTGCSVTSSEHSELENGIQSSSDPALMELIRYSPAEDYLGTLRWPLDKGKIGSRFGMRGDRFHEGIDIRADIGNSIFASHDGVVAFSGQLWSGYGNMIVLQGDGFYTVYAHNNQNFVAEGDEVEAGEEIATVGQTGNATGPHLHFEVRVDNRAGHKVAVNPYIFLKSRQGQAVQTAQR